MMGNMSGIMSMMNAAQSGQPIALPPLDVPCAVCTIRAHDGDAASLAEAPPALRSVTMIAGTPVCATHGRELLDAIVGGRS